MFQVDFSILLANVSFSIHLGYAFDEMTCRTCSFLNHLHSSKHFWLEESKCFERRLTGCLLQLNATDHNDRPGLDSSDMWHSW